MGRRFHAATRKGLFTIEEQHGAGGSSWRIGDVAFLGDNCSAVLHDRRQGTLYAALDHGHFGVKLHRSADGGRSWEEIAVPTYPAPPAGEEEWKDAFGRTIPSHLTLIWCLEAGHDSEPGVLWCGTMPGGVFRSRDRGDSWSPMERLWNHPWRKRWAGGGTDAPGVHSICVHPEDPRQVLVAVSSGGVWRTKDGGNTWDCEGKGWRAEYTPPDQAADPVAQDPHRLVQCRRSPHHLWVQHHNGIFRSTDSGYTWNEITGVSPSAFGFAAAVHPEDPDTAWFVPAVKDEKRIPLDGRVVVNRTRDGGKTFETLSRGLPQEHAYDLVYRHALDIASDGETLAFGSTTGSLWVTDDQGERWQCVAQHLPPIYCVRFEE